MLLSNPFTFDSITFALKMATSDDDSFRFESLDFLADLAKILLNGPVAGFEEDANSAWW